MMSITDHGPKRRSVEVTRLSDNLLAPKVFVAEIRNDHHEPVRYAIQFVGQDEGTAPVWHEVETVRLARREIKAAVKAREAQNRRTQ